MARSQWRRRFGSRKGRRPHDGVSHKSSRGHDSYITDQLLKACAGYYTMYDEPMPSLQELLDRS